MSQEVLHEAVLLRTVLSVFVVLSAVLSPVRAASIDTLDSVDCVIYPSQEADVGSGTVGVLESVLVDRAEFVKKGAAIAQLESSAEQAAVALATARANAAAEVNFRRLSAEHSKRQYSRIEQLVEKNSVSAKDLDDRKTEAQLGEQQLLKATESKYILALELDRAKVALEKRTIRSPFSGVVVETYKSAGEYIDSDPVLRIVQLHPLHIETIIPAEHVGDIQPGMRAEIVSADFPDKRWIARVDRVDSVVDVASGTFGVRLELPNPDFAITAGLRCQLSFIDDKGLVSSAFTSESTTANESQRMPSKVSRDQTSAGTKNTTPQPTLAAAKVAVSDEPIVEQAHGADNDGTVVSSSANIQSAKTLACINEGPYDDKDVAQEQARKWLQRGDTVEVVTKLVSEQLGYLVVSPVFESRDDVNTYLSNLKTIGITDWFLPSKKTPARVSIGAFRDHDKAESRIKQLTTNGIQSEIQAWKEFHQKYFLIGQRGQRSVSTDCESPTSVQ